MQTWRIRRARTSSFHNLSLLKQTAETEEKQICLLLIIIPTIEQMQAPSYLCCFELYTYFFCSASSYIHSLLSSPFVCLVLMHPWRLNKYEQLQFRVFWEKDCQRLCHMLSAWAWSWTIPTRMSYSVLLQDAAVWHDFSLGSEPVPQPEN